MDPATMQMLASIFAGGGGQGGGGGKPLIGGGNLSAIGQILSGIFNDSGRPYKDAEKQLRESYGQAQERQNPFYQAGTAAIPQYQEWLTGQKDPSGFINKLMGQYSESPWAKYQQDQSARRFGNAGSAAGLTGSTPLAQFEQQSMHDISSEDQDKWLKHVLGINTQYGQGVNNMINTGQHAADQMTSTDTDFGKAIAAMKYGQTAGRQQDRNSIFGGLFG